MKLNVPLIPKGIPSDIFVYMYYFDRSCLGWLLPFQITSLYLANAGVPLFSQSIIYQILLLVPIVVIEAYVHKKLLQVTLIKAIGVSLSTNLISTLVGGLLILLDLKELKKKK